MTGQPTEIGTSRLLGQPIEGDGEGEGEKPTTVNPPPAKTLAASLTADQVEELRAAIINELHCCFDPEIPVNIYELGLIYDIDIQPSGTVGIRMTLTSPACPVAGSLPGEVKARICSLPNVTAASVDVVWEPPWDKDRMSEAAKLQLGIDD
jgi:FeS assembly SUF system protein